MRRRAQREGKEQERWHLLAADQVQVSSTVPAAEKLPVDERHWQKKQIKSRLNADHLSSTPGEGEQHEQVNTDHHLQPAILWKMKTPITKVKFCQALVSQNVCNSLKKK